MAGGKIEVARLADLNNEPDARTAITFEGAVRLEIEVGRDRLSKTSKRSPQPCTSKVSWGSRQGLTLDEAEEFFTRGLEAVALARADVQRRSEADTPDEPREFPVDRP